MCGYNAKNCLMIVTAISAITEKIRYGYTDITEVKLVGILGFNGAFATA